MKLHFLDKRLVKGGMAEYSIVVTENEEINAKKKLVIFGALELGYTLKNTIALAGGV